MRFSVLIPVYNTEKYLDECLQSVLDQTYQDFEVILVDDGSTDNSPQICDDYQAKYPEVIRVLHQQNSGQLLSRINAIYAAHGDYCIFLDSDDLLVDNALETLHEQIISQLSPDMITYLFYYDRDGKLEKSRGICEENKLFCETDITELHKLFFADVLLNSMCTKAVKREILLKSTCHAEKFSSLRCAEDRLQSMWILNNIHSAFYLNEPLYRYRLVVGSTTRTYTVNNIDKYNTAVLYNEEKKYLQKWGFISDEQTDIFEAKYVSYLMYVFDLFYLNVDKRDRNRVIDYEWKSFLSDEFDISEVKNNSQISEKQKILFQWILDKEIKSIKKYYLKKRTYKALRNAKRKVFD